MPFYYHKVFYYVSSLLLLAIGSIKLALVLSVMTFLVVAGFGLFLCVRELTKNKYLIYGMPLLYIVTNYFFTNWLVRGAFAEFAAMSIVPYLLWWSIKLVKHRVFSYNIIPIFFLLYFSHNITALLAVPIPAVAYLISLRDSWGDPKKRKYFFKRLATATVSLFVLMTPYLVVYKIFSADYNPASITEGVFEPKNQVLPASVYLYDRNYSWLEDWKTQGLQIDFALTILIVLALSSLFYFKVRKGKNIGKKNNELTYLLGVPLIIYVLLQLKPFLWVYEVLEPLKLVQFPWRMEVFIVPLIILFSVHIISQHDISSERNNTIGVLVGILVILSVLTSPLLKKFNYAFIEQDVLDSSLEQANLSNAALGIGEYLPRITNNDGDELVATDKKRMYTKGYEVTNVCEVKEIKTGSKELRKRKFTVDCPYAERVSLPVNYSKLMLVRQEFGNSIEATRTSSSPLASINVGQGEHVVVVEQPTILNIIGYLLK